MTECALSLRSFGVAFGRDVILSDVSFELPATGLTLLVGPASSGKSTLVRTLSGANDCHPSLCTWGDVTFPARFASSPSPTCGGQGVRPALVMQHARFFLDDVRENLVSALPNRSQLDRSTQTALILRRLEESGLGELSSQLGRDVVSLPLPLQRRLAIACAVMSDPSVLFVDEVAFGLEDSAADAVVALLKEQSQRRSILFITHNQRLATTAGGWTLLLAGGRIQESASTTSFFHDPQTELGRSFVRTGGCVVASPKATRQELSERVEPVPAPPKRFGPPSHTLGPRGFFWIWPGCLGGTPRPGIIDRVEHDIEGLKRLRVTQLITLEETQTVAPALLARHGIGSTHLPVVDMSVPEVDDAIALCGRIARWLEQGESVALHCRAGLGRTGTLLACQLIWRGMSAREALESVRHVNPRCIQSEAQVAFLRTFELTRPRAQRSETSH